MSFFSKTSLIGGSDNYGNTAPMEVYAKKTVSTEGANANLELNSRDRNSGTLSNKKTQPYNNFVLQKGFPILQGQISSLKVDEIVMPVPYNITPYNNSLTAIAFVNDTTFVAQDIVISPGYYTGKQLAVLLEFYLNNDLAGNPDVFPGGGSAPTVSYQADGSFLFNIDLTGYVAWAIVPRLNSNNLPVSRSALNAQFAGVRPEAMGLLWTIGWNNYMYNSFYIPKATDANGNPLNGLQPYASGQASCLYTEYIDICSDVLTQYQELTDTSTDLTNPAHILCRVYIANEVSLPQVDASGAIVLPGTQYTKIHRQFKNPKVIRWNGQNSIDRVDLQLFDDLGRPLYFNPSGCDDFQITFSAVEL